MKKYFIFLLFTLSAGPYIDGSAFGATSSKHDSNGYHFLVGGIPDWVKPYPDPSIDKPLNDQVSVKYLQFDTQMMVDKNGDTERYSQIALTPRSENGLNESSEFQIRFNPQYQTLTIHRILLIREGQLIDKLKPANIKLSQRETEFDRNIYDGVVTALIVLDDVRVGDIVTYSYSISGQNPVFGNKLFSRFSLGWSTPVESARVRILTPSSRKLYYKVFLSNVISEIVSHDDQTEYEWRQTNIPPSSNERESPPWFNPYPWLLVTEYSDWKDIERWAIDLYKFDEKLAPDLASRVESWKKQSPDLEARALSALRFVQDEIRYFGVELGQNSHRPNSPNTVFNNRYGDCKDKTVLLVAILGELGIKARPALVSYADGTEIQHWLPTPGAFDHVIVAADINGSRYWLDGTRRFQRGNLANLSLYPFGKALVIGDGDSNLQTVARRPENTSRIEVVEKFSSSDYKGPAELSVKTQHFGSSAEAQREYYQSTKREDIGINYVNYYSRWYPGIRAEDTPKFDDNQEDNIVTIYEHYTVPEFWKQEDKQYSATLLASSIGSYTHLPQTIERKTPLAVAHPIEVLHRSVLDFPFKLDFDTSKDKVDVEDPYVAFHRSSKFEANRLVVNSHYQSKADYVEPSALKPHLANLRRINENLSYSPYIPIVTKNSRAKYDNVAENLYNQGYSSTYSLGIGFPQVLSASLGLMAPLYANSADSYIPAFKVETELGLGAYSISGGMAMVAPGRKVVSLKYARLSTWVTGYYLNYQGLTLEYNTTKSLPIRFGVGIFEPMDRSDRHGTNFTSFFIGLGQ